MSQVIWLPVDLPPLILVGTVCVVVLVFVYLVLEDLAFPQLLAVVFVLPCWILLVRALQHLARNHTQAEADLQNFSVRKATCCVESDRQWVEANVVACMRKLKRVHANSTAEEALATFDALVQQTMPQAIQVSVGRVGVGYKLLLPIVVALVAGRFGQLCQEHSCRRQRPEAGRSLAGGHHRGRHLACPSASPWPCVSTLVPSAPVPSRRGWRVLCGRSV